MNKNKITLTIIFVFLLSIIFIMYNKISNTNKNLELYESSIRALNDSLTVKIDGQTAIWTKLTPEIDINNLINSEYFKTLSKEQQNYYTELQKIKGLIASTKAELKKQGEILDNLNVNSISNISNDSISFKRGQELTWTEQDTTKNLQWNANIKLDSITDFSFKYKYNFDIQTDFIRNKDKSIKVQYKINDPDLIMNKNYSFIIPTEQKSKWQNFIYKNGKWIKPIGAIILVGTGTFIGYKIAK